MAYEQQFVAVVEQGGRVLREHDGVVRMPFGEDYGLRLKNLGSRRAVVSVSIDGEDVLGGKRVVAEPDSETRLDGFMDQSGRVRWRFRFIRKTEEIVEHRGDRLDDGVIRVEFRFERERPEVRRVTTIHNDEWYNYRPLWPYDPWRPYVRPHLLHYEPLVYRGGSPTITWSTSNTTGTLTCSAMPCTLTASRSPMADEGITVKGDRAEQDFRPICTDELEEASHVIVIRLRGASTAGQLVKRVVTTRQRLACPTCGRESRSDAEYCSRCGTALAE